MSPKQLHLDFECLTPISAPTIFYRFPTITLEDLEAFPETRERAESCLDFAWHMDGGKGYELNKQLPPDKSRKYLRALLAEFVSLEEATSLDLSNNPNIVPKKIRKRNDPRLHFLQLLRHANIHLECSSLSSMSKDAIWQFQGDNNEFTYKYFVVTNLLETVSSTINAKHYSHEDLAKMTDLFEIDQREWGIQNVIINCVEIYLKGIGIV